MRQDFTTQPSHHTDKHFIPVWLANIMHCQMISHYVEAKVMANVTFSPEPSVLTRRSFIFIHWNEWGGLAFSCSTTVSLNTASNDEVFHIGLETLGPHCKWKWFEEPSGYTFLKTDIHMNTQHGVYTCSLYHKHSHQVLPPPLELSLRSSFLFLHKRISGGKGQEVAYLFQSRFHKYQSET